MKGLPKGELFNRLAELANWRTQLLSLHLGTSAASGMDGAASWARRVAKGIFQRQAHPQPSPLGAATGDLAPAAPAEPLCLWQQLLGAIAALADQKHPARLVGAGKALPQRAR